MYRPIEAAEESNAIVVAAVKEEGDEVGELSFAPNTMKDEAVDMGFEKTTLLEVSETVGKKRLMKNKLPMKRSSFQKTEILEVGAMVGVAVGGLLGRKVGEVKRVVT